MKIVIYSPSSGIWGGGQIYIDQLCDYIGKRGIDACITSCEPKTFQSTSITIPSAASRFDRLGSSLALARKWKKDNFTHVLLNDLASIWLALVFRANGLKVISLLRLRLYLKKRKGNMLGHTFIEYYLIKFSSSFCNRIFSVNKDNINVFGDRVTFIGNFVPDWFYTEGKSRKSIKEVDFIYVGRFAVEKNLPLFLDLLKNLNEWTGKSRTALLLGAREQEDFIRERTELLGEIHYVEIQPWKQRQDLPKIYDRSKCFVVSSFHEGFATTLIEAYARGLPSIVTNSSGFCAEFVNGFGVSTGILFEPNDVADDAFVDNVANLVENHKNYSSDCIHSRP